MTTIEYNSCVDKFSDGVYRFILKNIKDDDKAKDVVQESFTKMWEKVGDITYSKAKSYLFTTAYHTMIDAIRKDKKQTNYDDIAPYDTFGHEDGYSDLKEILNEAVNKLPEVQRSVIMLRDYEGYSYKEIGDIVNLNESQVKVYIYRARVFLKNYIGSMDMVV
ncbi:MAG: RNA polymerase sigma factor [Saprospiraceae bacterium]|nr:RNA polymerase sigma factor [Saprospiraceae bacterium]